jgi:hypothetical protein
MDWNSSSRLLVGTSHDVAMALAISALSAPLAGMELAS